MSTLLYAVRPNVVAARARSKQYLRRTLLQRKPTLADRVWALAARAFWNITDASSERIRIAVFDWKSRLKNPV